MKNALLILLFVSLGVSARSQSCEDRVAKLLESVGTFSAATLYNMYAAIGSIGDGYGHDAYDAVTVNELLDAQIRLSDNLVRVLRDLKDEKIIITPQDIQYATSAAAILEGLKAQARLMEDYVNNNKQQKLNEYHNQRKKNWSAISKLMGIGE